MKQFKITLLGISLIFFLAVLCVQQLFSPCFSGFLIGVGLLVVYGLVLLSFLHHYAKPLEKVLQAATPFLKGKLPYLVIEDFKDMKPFGTIAEVFNSLSEKIHMHIQSSREKDREIEGLLDSLNEGVIAFNMKAKIIFVNQVACQWLKISKEAVIGQHIGSFHRDDPFSVKCHAIVEHVLMTCESRTEKWTQEGRIFDLVASPLLHKEGAILVIQDKTSDYKILEMGKNFIANASHELRTPITIVRGFAEMLQNVSQLSPTTMGDITNKIISTCDRLDKLVKSLLRIADIENTSVDRFKSCHLQPLFTHLEHLLRSAYPKIIFSCSEIDPKISVLGDYDLLDLAFMNILENAVKYSSGKPKISIVLRQMQDVVEIDFIDEGIGIPLVDLPYIFDRFYTVDKARSRKSGGAGLGLSIVKTIIEKHGGKIFVTSNEAKGSVFSISLPCFIEKNYNRF